MNNNPIHCAIVIETKARMLGAMHMYAHSKVERLSSGRHR
jgi:hypothetical protein